jgi:murein L,D-transpeptidase YafK
VTTRHQKVAYVLDRRNSKSKFHKAIHISYPNEEDRNQAAEREVWPGGDIMLHGLPYGFGWLGEVHSSRDSTDGCIAVTNKEIDEIWELVPEGTPSDIRP